MLSLCPPTLNPGINVCRWHRRNLPENPWYRPKQVNVGSHYRLYHASPCFLAVLSSLWAGLVYKNANFVVFGLQRLRGSLGKHRGAFGDSYPDYPLIDLTITPKE